MKEQAELRKQPNGLDNLDEWQKAGSDKMEDDNADNIEEAVTMLSGP